MAADDPFERRLSAGLHAALDAVDPPHPTWASSPAARRVTGRSSGASRRGALWLLAAAVMVGVVGAALLVAGGGLPPRTSPIATPTASASTGPPSRLPGSLELVGQAPGSAGHAEGPIVALGVSPPGVSAQPSTALSFWSWDPASQAWTAGPFVPFPFSGGLNDASDGITVVTDPVDVTRHTVFLAALTAEASWRQVALPAAMATAGWDPTGALLARPAGGYVASRAGMLWVINDDGTTRTAATPAAAPIVMAGTSDPDWYVVTTLAGMQTVSYAAYPAQLWNAATGALVPLGDVDDVAPAHAGLAYVRTFGPSAASDWQLATADGLSLAAPDAADTEIDPSGRLLFRRDSACILDAAAAAPREALGACLAALPNGPEGPLSADGPVLWGVGSAFVTPVRTPAAGPFPVELGLAMLSAAGPRLIGFPPFATRPAPTTSPTLPTATPSVVLTPS